MLSYLSFTIIPDIIFCDINASSTCHLQPYTDLLAHSWVRNSTNVRFCDLEYVVISLLLIIPITSINLVCANNNNKACKFGTNLGHSHEKVLDLCRVDVLSTSDDHIFHATRDHDTAIGRHDRLVTEFINITSKCLIKVINSSSTLLFVLSTYPEWNQLFLMASAVLSDWSRYPWKIWYPLEQSSPRDSKGTTRPSLSIIFT